LGLFVGLTGARFSGYDAVAIGMAEGFVRSKKKRDLFAGLSRLGWTLDPAKNKEILRGYLSNEFETDVAGDPIFAEVSKLSDGSAAAEASRKSIALCGIGKEMIRGSSARSPVISPPLRPR
jgi:hypothetical protein